MAGRPTSHPLPRLTVTRRVIRYIPIQNPRYYLDLHKDVPSCFEKQSPKHQRELRRKLRRFQEACRGEHIIREYQFPDEMPTFSRLAREVSETTPHDYLARGLAVSDLMPLAQQCAVRGHVLFHGQRPVAFEYCRAFDDILTGELCGYDPAFAKWSPGTVLLYCVLLQLAEKRTFRLLDFGPGYAPYKEGIATGTVYCADIYYFRNTAAHLGIVLTHLLFSAACRVIGNALDLVNLRHLLKGLFRRLSRNGSADQPLLGGFTIKTG